MALTPPLGGSTAFPAEQSGPKSPTILTPSSSYGFPYNDSRPASGHRQASNATTYHSFDHDMASSQPSHGTLQSTASPARGGKRLRSQYPLDSGQSHVEFILVASFDIDRGSIMEHQYPGPISGDETMLAELMLPDQAHNRSQDWTIFFLHKDTSEDEQEDTASNNTRRKRRGGGNGSDGGENGHASPGAGSGNEDEEEDDDDDDDMEGPPLIYVLNLVNTKHDSTYKRGAVVKAMAICTRHPFLHIYKPLLLLALEEYFRSPVPETLEALYDSVNRMDLSLMPRLSLLERIILQASSSKTIFSEKFQRMIEQRQEDETDPAEVSKKTSSAPATRYLLPRDTHEFESKILYNNISVPVKVPTARAPEMVGDFSIIKLIQTFSTPHASQPQQFTLHPHLTTNGAHTHPIIVLVNALLTQKRIMFIGHNRPSGEVAEAVLAACALASGGLLRGFTRHAFPYTDLTKIDDLLKVPGFVAGVTNPAFANKPEWWDLLCDLPSGRMKISSKIETPQPNEGLLSFQAQNPSFAAAAVQASSSSSQNSAAQDTTGDIAFMETVLRNIANRLGEGSIRAMWRDWIVKFSRIAAAYEEAVYGASALYIGGEEADAGAYGVRGHGYVWSDDATRQRELAGNAHRIEGWRASRSYFSLVQDQAKLYVKTRPIAALDLHHHHDRLRTQKLHRDDSASIYLAFEQAIQDQGEINQLLTVTSESHGGLFYIALGLFHPQRDVRFMTVALIERIRHNEAGHLFWASLGRFAKLAFFRLKREMEAGGKEDDGVRKAVTQPPTFTSQTGIAAV